MRAPKMRDAAWIAAVLIVAGFAPAGAQEAGVTVARAVLPPAESAYHGGTHVFPGAGARLFCGTHGGFTSSVVPPAMPGTTVIADYRATFIGDLVLGSAATDVHPISEPVHMVERITFGERRGDEQVLDTEIVALDLQGSGLPRGVLVRESPSRGSFGSTTMTRLARGRTRIESYYDVWLEISIDGGRSWHAAEGAVRMSIGPEGPPRPRSLQGG